MPLDEADLKYMWDMLDAARRTVAFTSGVTREAYLADQLRQSAVERVIEIIGEAARHVTDEGRTQVPAVAWTAIVGTRHIIAHEYGSIDHDRIWRIATTHVPALIQALAPVLDANPPGPASQSDPAEP